MPEKPSILGVVINWRRPKNIPLVLRSMREQSVPLHIALVECAPGTEFETSPETKKLADTVFSISTNCGPRSRFVPSLMMPEFEWTYFGVDDWVPGREHVEFLHHWFCAQPCATIGQDGRLVSPDQQALTGGKCKTTDSTKRVDVITSSELCRTSDVSYAVRFMDDIRRADAGVSIFEDDLLLCFGLQKYTHQPSRVTPTPTLEQSWRAKRLPAPDALSARPDHREGRDRFVKAAVRAGWMCRSAAVAHAAD